MENTETVESPKRHPVKETQVSSRYVFSLPELYELGRNINE